MKDRKDLKEREKSREGRRNFSRSVPFLVVRSFTFFFCPRCESREYTFSVVHDDGVPLPPGYAFAEPRGRRTRRAALARPRWTRMYIRGRDVEGGGGEGEREREFPFAAYVAAVGRYK